MSKRRSVLLTAALLGVIALGAWIALSDGRVSGTPFYTCVHGCTRFLSLTPCDGAPPQTNYISGDGCGIGSGLVVWIDESASVLTVYGAPDQEARPVGFDYSSASGDAFCQAQRSGDLRRVVVP